MLAWLLPLIFAPFAGSLVGVLIRRLPAGRAVMWARSECETCGCRLGPADLIPVASYLLLRGHCRHCNAPIGPFHPAVELAAFAVALTAVLAAPEPGLAWAGCGLGWGLLALGWIDWQHWRLPDALTLPLVILGLVATALLLPAALPDHAIGAMVGWAAFRGISLLYRWLRGREGLGEGDAKLLAVAGAWVGWPNLPMVVLLAALLGIGVAFARGGRLRGSLVLPFGPCMAVALWLVWLDATASSF